MTVHSPLSPDEVRDLLTLYDVGALEHLEPARGASRNTVYLLTTERGRYVLRLNEQQRFRDLVYEKDALVFLQQAGLSFATPAIVPNVVTGYLTPLAPDRYASLFGLVDGRALGRWELEPAHCAQVGQSLAELHQCGQSFKGYRRHPQRPDRVREQLRGVRGVAAEEALFVRQARRALDGLQRAVATRVPHSLLHGEPLVEHARFRRGQLVGWIDFERTARGPLLLDVAEALLDWASEDDGALDPARASALLAGYGQRRPLGTTEGRILWDVARYVALASAVDQLVRCELQQPAASGRYRDYRTPLRRWQALEALGRRGFARACGQLAAPVEEAP